MKLSLAVRSWIMLVVSIIFLVVLTVADSAMAGMSTGTQRLIAIVALVLAPGFGVVLGVMSLVRKEGRSWLALIGVALNGLFALFHLMVVMFAG